MDIKKYFEKIRSFKLLFVLLGRKKKKLLDDILLNEGLIKYYESKISDAVKEIKISKIKIENIEQNNKQIREYISNIRKLE